MGTSRCIVHLPACARIVQIGGVLLPEMAEQETRRYERLMGDGGLIRFQTTRSRWDGGVSTPSPHAEQSSIRIISCTAEAARSLRRKLLMVHCHPTLCRILGLVFLCCTLVLMVLSAAPAWPSETRAALFLLSLFPLILSLSYFHLGNQEERGY